MSAQAHTYLCDAWNRDKVMAIVQFLPMALEGPARTAGCESLALSLGNLARMGDAYRAVTRLSLLANALSKPTLTSLSKPAGDMVASRIDQLSHLFHIGFCLNENTAVLAGHGVFPKSLHRLSGVAVLCWMYTLVLGIVRQLYMLSKMRGHCTAAAASGDDKRKTCPYGGCKRVMVDLLKLVCYFLFALTCLPEGKPQLLANASGPLVPLHVMVKALSPNPLHASNTVRGLLGLIASVCEFY
ncbi:Gim5B protein [Trypanosoma brucei gambiense DAL972]|uniref:Gim5B protein n=2 Tax=Trypanosoma brucei TaxID=5691 RepID=C9ZYW6_TRYB9|nr:Gim5B protein [Trypanosoma brucei gambiense DAL972]CAB94857.1 GIM5B protein [Trypanosoma brucei brucei]CBH14615.1 Gim5B protein [Trypanosoma brucei gambiense DAL972]|eukprot:XP_011776881.1 Gim5B protein [Trypanosoma brucei gambiense DAL972]